MQPAARYRRWLVLASRILGVQSLESLAAEAKVVNMCPKDIKAVEPDPDPLNPTMPEEQIARLDHRLRFLVEDFESGLRSLNHPKPFQAAKSLASQRLDLMVPEDMQKVKRQRRCLVSGQRLGTADPPVWEL